MIYTLQKRHEFDCGIMYTHYEVMSYTHRTELGILVNGKVLKKGTKKECEKYIARKSIEIEKGDKKIC